MEKCKIIENTEEAKDREGYLDGTGTIFLYDEDIKALQEGKCISTSINDEYRIFVEKA